MLAKAQQSCYVHQQMNNSKTTHYAQARRDQTASKIGQAGSAQPQYKQLILATDVHADSIVAIRVMDGAKPQPPQTFKLAGPLAWVQKQKALTASPAHGCQSSCMVRMAPDLRKRWFQHHALSNAGTRQAPTIS